MGLDVVVDSFYVIFFSNINSTVLNNNSADKKHKIATTKMCEGKGESSNSPDSHLSETETLETPETLFP